MTTATTRNLDNIRPLCAHDLAAAQALAKACAVYAPNGEERLLLGIFHDGELAGFAAWQHVLDEATLLAIAIHPTQRRRGLAAALLAAGEARLPHVRHTFLEVRAGNLAAQQLYRRQGFTDIARRRAYYGDEDALIMRKESP